MDETQFNINLLEPLIQFSGTISERISKTEEAFTRICRTCLCETTDNILESNSFLSKDTSGSLVTIKEMMEVSTGLEINADDKLPRHICDSCLKSIEAAYSFRTQSQRIDEVLNGVLREMYSIKEGKYSENESDPCKKEAVSVKPEKIDEPPDDQIEADDNHAASSFVCNSCNMTFSNEIDLVKHKAEHIPKSSKKKLFKCGICSKEYSFRNGLHNHLMVTHIQKKEYQCPVCRRIFKKRDRLQQHRRSYCIAQADVPKVSTSLSSVTVHPSEELSMESVVVEIKNFTCSLCREKFELEADFNGHMIVHAADKTCEYCKKSFTRASYLESHIRSHTNDKPFVCPFCAKGFTATRTFRSHIKTHAQREVFSCEKCDKDFFSERDLLRHLKTHKNKKEQIAETTSCEETLLKPNDCEKRLYKDEPDSVTNTSPIETTGSLATLSLNNDKLRMKPAFSTAESSSAPIPSVCKIEPGIAMDFQTTDSVRIKEEDIEAPSTPVESSANDNLWEEPPAGFEIIVKDEGTGAPEIVNEPISDGEQTLLDPFDPTLAQMPEAVSSDITIDDVKLEQSGDGESTLNTSNELADADQASSNQPKPNLIPISPAEVYGRFICGVPECTAEYKFYREIINHYANQHCTGPPYTCPVCAKQFLVKRAVRNHLKSHVTCEYKCPYCTKAYLQLRDLKIHLRTHTGERPFKCPKCPKRFKQRPALKVHINTHNICKEYKCGTCSKEFFSYNGLFLHEKGHKENKELQCPFCGKQFPTKSRLKRHQNGICGSSRTPAKS